MATTDPAPAPAPAPSNPTVWQAFVSTLAELAGSKKSIVLLGSVIAWVALKLGWHVDQNTIDRYLALAASYLLGQGIADHGKGAAEEHGRTARALAASGVPAGAVLSALAKPSRSPAAGFVRAQVLVALAALGLAASTMFVGCSHPGQVALGIGQCVYDSGIMTKVLFDLQQANYVVLIGDALGAAPELVKCALQVIAASESSPPPDAGSAGSATQLRRGPYDHVVVARAQEMLAKFGGAK